MYANCSSSAHNLDVDCDWRSAWQSDMLRRQERGDHGGYGSEIRVRYSHMIDIIQHRA